MPTYEAKCSGCGTVQTFRASISERDNTPPCKKCEEPTERTIITPPMGFVDTPAAG